MKPVDFLMRLAAPLNSRKVRVALATVVASIAASYGLALREDVVHTILGVGAALILGIAHEDTARLGQADPAGDAGNESPGPTAS